MPELGKATYWLTLNSKAALAEMDVTEQQLIAGTDRIATGFNTADRTIVRMTTGLKTAAVTSKVAGAEMEAASVGAATVATKSATKSETAWARASTAIKKHGKIGGQFGSMIGLGAAYLLIKGGVTWLKDANAGWAQLKNAIKVTGDVSGVTASHAGALATYWEKVTGAEKGTTLQTESLMLRFKNIRDVGTGANAIFDRTLAAVENIASATGRSIQAVTAQIGKAVQDPTKYLGLLGRAGITFTKVQQDMVKHIAATQGTLAAQKYVLSQLEDRYKGAAAAAGKTLGGQLKIARAQIDQSSASIIHGLLPAFVQLVAVLKSVAVFLGQHTTALKNLIIGYVILKTTLFAARTAIMAFEAAAVLAKGVTIAWRMAVYGLSLSQAIATTRTVELGAAAEVTAGEEGGATIATAALSGAVDTLATSMIALLPEIALVVAAYAALKWAADQANKAINAETDATKHLLTRTPLELTILAEPYEKGIRKGEKPALAMKQAKALWEKRAKDPKAVAGFARQVGITTAQAKSDMEKYAGGKATKIGQDKLPPKVTPPPKVLTVTTKALKGADLIPVAMRTAEYKALAETGTKGLRDQQAIYKEEDTYLHGLLAKVKGNSLKAQQARAIIWQQIDSVMSSITSKTAKLHKTMTPKAVTLSKLIPQKMQQAILRASGTTSLADDLKAWSAEKAYLVHLLKEKVMQGAKHAAERTMILKQIALAGSKVSSIQNKITGAKDRTFQDNEDIALSKASLLGGKAGAAKTATIQEQIRKHELKILTTQEDGLKARLKQKGLSLDKQAALWKKIAALDTKRLALAKTVTAGSTAMEKEITAAMSLRASFFGQFASDVFHQTKAGLQMGSAVDPAAQVNSTKTIHYDQTNHYNEIPKNRHHAASQARRAVAAQWAGPN